MGSPRVRKNHAFKGFVTKIQFRETRPAWTGKALLIFERSAHF